MFEDVEIPALKVLAKAGLLWSNGETWDDSNARMFNEPCKLEVAAIRDVPGAGKNPAAFPPSNGENARPLSGIRTEDPAAFPL